MVMKGLGEFQQLKIPRWIGYANDVISAEIHVWRCIRISVWSRSLRQAPKEKRKSLRHHAN
jgi:hypothetical protein